jgi:hypothetical protein
MTGALLIPPDSIRARHFLPVAIVIALVAYLPALFNEHAYDAAMLLDRLAGPPPAAPPVLLDPAAYGSATAVMSWRPLGVLVLMLLDRDLFGGSALLGNLLNILVHSLNGALLLAFLRQHVRGVVPLLAAALFVVHPLASEVVYCAGFRFDSLALGGALSALWIAGEYIYRGGWWRLCLYFMMLVVALGFKESAVFAIVIWPALLVLRGDGRRALLIGGLGVAALALFLAAWMPFRYVDPSRGWLGGGGRLLGMANFIVALGEIYAPRLVMPWGLRIDHGFAPLKSLLEVRLIFAISVIVFMAGLAILAIRFRPRAGWLAAVWVVAALAPVSQLVPIPDPVAERLVYSALPGFCLLLALFLHRLPRPVLLGLLLLLAGMTAARGLDWRDDRTLNLRNWQYDDRPVGLRPAAALFVDSALAQHDPAAARRLAGEAMVRLGRLEAQMGADGEIRRLQALALMLQGDLANARLRAAEAAALDPADPRSAALVARLAAMEEASPP